jgi:hypothetical protein
MFPPIDAGDQAAGGGTREQTAALAGHDQPCRVGIERVAFVEFDALVEPVEQGAHAGVDKRGRRDEGDPGRRSAVAIGKPPQRVHRDVLMSVRILVFVEQQHRKLGEVHLPSQPWIARVSWPSLANA